MASLEMSVHLVITVLCVARHLLDVLTVCQGLFATVALYLRQRRFSVNQSQIYTITSHIVLFYCAYILYAVFGSRWYSGVERLQQWLRHLQEPGF